jgi:membrane associated rhomboid family serine protease
MMPVRKKTISILLVCALALAAAHPVVGRDVLETFSQGVHGWRFFLVAYALLASSYERETSGKTWLTETVILMKHSC